MSRIDDVPPEWARRLEEAIITDDTEAIEAPWIVVCSDSRTGFTSCSGPYPNGLAAIAVVEWEYTNQSPLPADEHFDFQAVRLSKPNLYADGSATPS